MASDAAGKGLLYKSDAIASIFRAEITRALLEHGSRKPKLVGILSTSAAPSKFYAEFTKKQCDELGVEFVLRKTGAALEQGEAEGEGVEEAIIEANEDDGVDGIMVSVACEFFRVPKLNPVDFHRYIILYLVPNRYICKLV
jgi:methylenetetrahydrofolate dehydrogenase (NAD+)